MFEEFISAWNSLYAMACVWFVFQIIFCEILFSYHLPRKDKFIRRAIGSSLVYLLVAYILAIPFACYIYVGDMIILYELVYFPLVWFLSLMGFHFCYKVKKMEILYYGVGAYALQHMIYLIGAFIKSFITSMNDIAERIVFEVLLFFVIGLVVYFLIIRPWNRSGNIKPKGIRVFFVAVCILISCIVLNTLAIFFTNDASNNLLVYICRPYGVLCCLIILVLLYDITRESKLENEKDIMEVLLHAEKEQHRMQKENIDIINMKCHDLKHQIALLKDTANTEDRNEAISELEKAVDIYDANVRTGNDSLDLLLTQKNLICRSMNIDFTYMIDGKLLVFLKTSDMLSLLGNILDNAIEAARLMPQGAKVITLKITQEGTAVFVHEENTFTSNLEFNDGLPQTTKKDKNYHGFGTKSIRYIAQKYKGELNMYVEDDKFNVDILFISPQNLKKNTQNDQMH